MSKKIKNYENDEAFKNFKLEDYLPSMNKREPEQEATTEEASLYPSLSEPDKSATQAMVSDATQADGQDVWEDADDENAEMASVEADVPLERAIVRRVSSKQRRLSLEEYRATYLKVPKLVNRKPVFVSETVRDELDRVVRFLGGKGMSASGLIENLVRLHLDTYRNDIEQWRKL